jgi:hypothetical protein
MVSIQALTGTNFDFSAYSSALKSSLGISQEVLNYLATASDLGESDRVLQPKRGRGVN